LFDRAITAALLSCGYGSGVSIMSKSALSDAFTAGWTSYRQGAGWDGLDEAFETWWSKSVNTLDRAPTTRPDLFEPVTFHVESYMVNPPKPTAIGILDKNRKFVAAGTLEDFKRCAADLERLEAARAPTAPICPDNSHDYRVDDSDGLLKCTTCGKVLF
jgi:hypothetical protein